MLEGGLRISNFVISIGVKNGGAAEKNGKNMNLLVTMHMMLLQKVGLTTQRIRVNFKEVNG